MTHDERMDGWMDNLLLIDQREIRLSTAWQPPVPKKGGGVCNVTLSLAEREGFGFNSKREPRTLTTFFCTFLM